jgi:uncharacterized membrane protein
MASSKARSRNRTAPGKGKTAASARAAAPGVKATPTSHAKPANGSKPAGTVRTVDPADSAGTAGQQAGQRKAQAGRPGSGAPADPAEPEVLRPAGPPMWLQLTTLALALLGLGIASYEWYAVWNGGHLAGCPTGGHGTFDCSAVLNSSQSKVFGIFDVAILGTFFYVFVVAIMTPWAWRMQSLNLGRLHLSVGWIRLAAMVTGMGFVMYLIYAELYQIGQVCEYCSGVHIVTFVLFCITLVSAAIWGLGKPKTAS